MLLPKATRIPSVSLTTLGHVGVQGPCCYHHHADMSGLYCHPGPWWHLGLSCCLGPCLDPWPSRSQVWVYACDSCYHQGLCQSLESEQPPKTMLVSEGHAASEAILIYVTCTVTGAMVMPKLLSRAMSGFVFQCSCCLWRCSCPVLPLGWGGNRNHACWNPRIASAFHWFWDSWPCSAAGELFPHSHLGEMVPTLTKAWENWLWRHVPRRAGSALCLKWVVPLAQTDQLSYYQDPHPWSWVGRHSLTSTPSITFWSTWGDWYCWMIAAGSS